MKDKNTTTFPFKNEQLPLKVRLDDFIERLTLEEKLQLLANAPIGIPRLGVQAFGIGGEAAHGVEARCDQDYNRGTPIPTTTFTQPIGMSATWDTELIEKAGMVTGTEARAVYAKKPWGGLSRWAPTVDMERDPRWGRTEEAYGEDPYLTGKMASAYVHGMQGKDSFYLRCGATLKHFYANNVETDRVKVSSSVDIRNKMEYYLEPFRRVVTEGKAEAIMTSYNEINGIPAILNPEVANQVKGHWKLRGHVVCDGGDFLQTVTEHHYYTTHAKTLAAGLKAGIDSFTDDAAEVVKAAKEALEKGWITEEEINKAVRNTSSTKFRLGIYDETPVCPYTRIDENNLNTKEHQEICSRVAKEAIVLLKNQEQLLPLHPEKKKKLAIVGPMADVWYKDWYSGVPEHGVTPMEGIQKRFGEEQILFTNGLSRIKIKHKEKYIGIQKDGSCVLTDADHAEVFELNDWGFGQYTLQAVTNGMFLTSDNADGRITASKKEAFGWFVKEVFHLEEMKKEEKSTTPEYYLKSWKEEKIGIDKNGCLKIAGETKDVLSVEVVSDGIQEAKKAAEQADVVIAVMGCQPMINSKEEVDRTSIDFIPSQRALLQEMYTKNKNIILVLVTNYPYAIDWEEEHLPAILMTASGSQDLGNAIAGALAGDFSPAGRLNMTWYQRDEDLPDINDYDIIRGNRTYQYFKGKVLYPFGYGLSYSRFEYSEITVLQEEQKLVVSANVKNIGNCVADEVVQLYVKQETSRTKRPEKQLKGFLRLTLNPSEEKRVTFEVPKEELKYFDVVSGKMLLEQSNYTFGLGGSSNNICVKKTVFIAGSVIYARDMTKPVLAEYYDDYNNLYLHRGHDDNSCILPLEHLETGCAYYRDVRFTFTPQQVLLDVMAEEAGKITVYFGDAKLAELKLTKMQSFETKKVILDTKQLVVGERKTIRIEIEGKIRVVAFSFH